MEQRPSPGPASVEREQMIVAGGRQLRTASFGKFEADCLTLVLMHGGLDCIATWKDFPKALHIATGLSVLAYDRWGYGGSERLEGRRSPDYRRQEAGPTLGEVLRHFGIRRAVLVGHSDGGAMALLAAAAHPEIVRGVLGLAPQLLMHPVCEQCMQAARQAFEAGDLRQRLARYHGDNTESMFYGWYGAWCSAEGAAWSMVRELGEVSCTTSVIFGLDDEYGHKPHLEVLIPAFNAPLEILTLSACGHHPHHQARAEVLAAVQRLLGRIGG